MAGRKENLKALFTNTRTRVIIVFTMVLLLLAVVVGVFKFLKSTPEELAPKANVSGAPSVGSIPAGMEPTPQYAALQEQQNKMQAEEAEKKGSSAIPTIIRTQNLGEGMEVVGAQGGESGVGFVTLSQGIERGEEQTLWLQQVKDANCSKVSLEKASTRGLTINQLKQVCSCLQLQDFGFSLKELSSACTCKDLRDLGYKAKELKDAGFTANRLRGCGFIACEMHSAGFTAQQLIDGGYSAGELKGAGYSEAEINQASGLPGNVSVEDVQKAGCDPQKLAQLRKSGVTAAAIKRINGCDITALKQAGFTAGDLKNAGYSAAELKRAGFTPTELKQAGFTAGELLDGGFTPEDLAAAGFTQEQIKEAVNAARAALKSKLTDCSPETLRKARASGISAAAIKNTLGCPVKALADAGFTAKELIEAGYSPAELKKAGFSANDLKNAGVDAKALKDAGFSAKELKDAGFNAAALKEAGFDAKALKDAGFNAKALKDAGFDAKALKEAGFDAKALKDAGFSPAALKEAGFDATALKNAGFTAAALKDAGFTNQQLVEAGFQIPGTSLSGLQSGENPQVRPLTSSVQRFAGGPNNSLANEIAQNNQQLDKVLADQNKRLAEQRLQQDISQRASDMQSAASQHLQNWAQVDVQVYQAGNQVTEKKEQGSGTLLPSINNNQTQAQTGMQGQPARPPIVKAGDILYAVIDTSVDSDEPGPVLATIVSPKLRGARLIGTFNLPANAEKMVINFTTMSVPGAPSTTGINAYAIDADTARTALSSRTDHHYLMRYGSLFASSFIEGLGNAIQTANTTITIGGTGGLTNTQVQNNRSGKVTLENAVIALSTVGKNWGQQAQQLFNRPTTVQVFSGTAVGILFMQDLTTI